MSTPASPVTPTSLVTTPIPGDWRQESDETKLSWLNKQPMVDDNTISIGSCVTSSTKISDLCGRFIDTINAFVAELGTRHVGQLLEAAEKFVDVTNKTLWRFNEQIVSDLNAVFDSGVFGLESVVIKPIHLNELELLPTSNQPKSNIAEEVFHILADVFKIACDNNASMNKYRPAIASSWAKLLADFVAAGDEFFPLLNGNAGTR
ncbi:uncharacterized protein AB675_9126 [Cyphellophora attinorum]|uniref:Uncharacterized protein n=1 Tax=Cyphellophora attinorum TaxID=1664694 RepID=A0A0N1HB62_9EURO|nr:uncharacterized protein AB675_9126 [Phialophora attinorum]KPI41476.1 hypothetical protein AB675_9126 [Phialophora attinorum]